MKWNSVVKEIFARDIKACDLWPSCHVIQDGSFKIMPGMVGILKVKNN